MTISIDGGEPVRLLDANRQEFQAGGLRPGLRHTFRTVSGRYVLATAPMSAAKIAEVDLLPATVVAASADAGGNIAGAVEVGYIRASDGSTAFNAAFLRTGFIPVRPGDYISSTGARQTAADAGHNISCYDAAMAFMGTINYLVEGEAIDVVDRVPGTAFVRVSANTTDLRVYCSRREVKAASADLAALASSLTDYNGFDGASINYINNLGQLAYHALWRTTPFINVSAGDLVRYQGTGSTVAYGVMGYDSAGGLVKPLVKINAASDLYFRVPEGIAKIRACAISTSPFGLFLRRTALPSLGFAKAKIGFIGDSITAGADTTDRANKSYVAVAARRLGATAVNLGTSGAQMDSTTASTAAYKNGSFFEAVTANLSDIATMSRLVVGYGTNDFGTGTRIGTIDDVQRGTFYGAMREALGLILDANPSVKLVFMLPIYRCVSAANRAENVAANAAGHTLEDYRSAIRMN